MIAVASLILSILTRGLITVDLDYGLYEGYTNITSGLQIWKGIRYAAPPVGELRFNRPEPPASNRTVIFNATQWPKQCPQSPNSISQGNTTQSRSDKLGSWSEDCLFLNVWKPINATDLPVMVWIHGGGYGQGNASYNDLSDLIATNNHSFVGVAIQYRLGAFGFLSSDEVYRNGVVNAGLYDIMFALGWIQQQIAKFGGDPSRVTIAGNSAGGGAVMLASMAYGGTLGSTLFSQGFASSPYLPMQYGYKDWLPSQSYYAFASQAGCAPSMAYGGAKSTILECLRSKSSEVLVRASQNISASGNYGTWGFLPVTDGELIRSIPSQQLTQHKVNGQRVLSGNAANEAASFVPTNISSERDLLDWLKTIFPLFSDDDIAKLLTYYPSTNSTVDTSDPLFATNGISAPTAINQSSFATGQQQRAFNIYAETTFVCPSYWLAEAYSGNSSQQSWKYQYSVPLAYHANDVSAFLGPAAITQGSDLERAFMHMIGNFVTQGNPSIALSLASGNVSASDNRSAKAASQWPPFSVAQPTMLNLNQTGGHAISVAATSEIHSTELIGPGLRSDFSLVNAYAWEGGRGERCEFWRSTGPKVPE